MARDWWDERKGGSEREEEREVSSSISLTFKRNEKERSSPAEEEKDRELDGPEQVDLKSKDVVAKEEGADRLEGGEDRTKEEGRKEDDEEEEEAALDASRRGAVEAKDRVTPVKSMVG